MPRTGGLSLAKALWFTRGFPQRLTPSYITSYKKEELGNLGKEYTRERPLVIRSNFRGVDSLLLKTVEDRWDQAG